MDRAPQAAQLTPCRQCGAPFAPKKPWQHFCGKPCRRAFHKARGGGSVDKRLAELERRVAELEAKQ